MIRHWFARAWRWWHAYQWPANHPYVYGWWFLLGMATMFAYYYVVSGLACIAVLLLVAFLIKAELHLHGDDDQP